jgi:hypothetical protein
VRSLLGLGAYWLGFGEQAFGKIYPALGEHDKVFGHWDALAEARGEAFPDLVLRLCLGSGIEELD